MLRRRLALSQSSGASSPTPSSTPSTVAKSPPTWNRTFDRLHVHAEGPSSASAPSGAVHDLIQVLGAPEMRQLACEVVGSAVWGGVRASADCAKDLAVACVPWSWKRGGRSLPAPVFLAVVLSLSIHVNNLGLL